jgi:4-amino-4-deoxy-L-arabinose transferase-like glycosyltransferase
VALATVVLHAAVGDRYGYHADELATLDDARHLAWGYPGYPPVTALFARISLILFGTNLVGFRFFASLAQAIAVVLAGLMARELGGGRGAQLFAAVAAVPFCIGGGALMQYVSFDYLAWVLVAFFVLKLCASGDPRFWVAVGASIGFGMLSKYTMAFFVVGLVAAMLLTDARRHLRTRWPWVGAAIAVLLFFPNLLWQWRHDFVALEILKAVHARDVSLGHTSRFLVDQVLFSNVPLVLAGLYFYLLGAAGRRFRVVGWTYLATLLLFVIAKGRGYYFFPAYPMIYAGAAAWGAGWLRSLRPWLARTIAGLAFARLAVAVALATAFFLPIAPIGSRWWEKSNALQETYRGEIGWPEMADEVARIRDSLTPPEREHLGILAATYGEAGAINLYGPAYGLPRAISGSSSYWDRGYGDPPPQTLIVLGLTSESAGEHLQSCRLAGHVWNRYGVATTETVYRPDIFVCGPPRRGWAEFWPRFRSYG